MLPVRRNRVHKQRCDPRHRRGRHARSVKRDVPAASSLTLCGVDAHARPHNVRRQPAVRRRTVAAERREVAAVHSGADRKRILGGAVVREAADARIRLRHHVELPVAPDRRVELARPDPAAPEDSRCRRQAHVDDQGLHPCGHAPSLAAAGLRGEEVHPARDAVAEPEAILAQHLGETDVADPRRHAREALLPEAVAGDRAGHVRPVSVVVDPQVIGLDERPVRAEAVREIGAADAVPVRGDIQVVDVESGVHHGDGHRCSAGAREDARGAVVGAQRVRTHRGHGRVVVRFDQTDGLHGEHEIGRGQRFDHAAAGIRPVDAQRRVVATHDRAEAFHRPAPAAVGVPGHQRDEDGPRRGARRLDLVAERRELDLRGGRAQPVDLSERRDLPETHGVAWEPRPDEPSRGADDHGVRAREDAGEIRAPGVPGQANPAERPVALGGGRLPGQRCDCVGGMQPFRAAPVPRCAARSSFDPCLGHRAEVVDECIALRRCGRGVVAGDVAVGATAYPRRRLHHGRRERTPAFRGDPGGRGRDNLLDIRPCRWRRSLDAGRADPRNPDEEASHKEHHGQRPGP